MVNRETYWILRQHALCNTKPGPQKYDYPPLHGRNIAAWIPKIQGIQFFTPEAEHSALFSEIEWQGDGNPVRELFWKYAGKNEI